MEATWGRGGVGSEWDDAVELAEQVAHGSPLPVLASTVLLDPGEVLHADVGAFGWRFQAMDVFYEEPRVLAFGGPVLFAAASIGAASERRRARAEAERLAAPQWRSLGELRVLATDRRLLIWFEGAWASVWYDGIRELHPDLVTVPGHDAVRRRPAVRARRTVGAVPDGDPHRVPWPHGTALTLSPMLSVPACSQLIARILR
jgi:hypothetical protein